MSYNKFLCCYFPTRVLFLDDNETFLETVRGYLLSKQKIVPFLSPLEATAFVKSQLTAQLQSRKWLTHFEDIEIMNESIEAHTTTNVDTFNIHKEIYNSKRFDDISVMVVDYTMPEQNGVDFYRQFKDSPIKKILITGNATLEVAINAFNEGIIDKFLVKEPGTAFLDKLSEEIITLQSAYFKDISATIMDQFSVVKDGPFNDDKFCKQYKELLEGVKLKEYYIIDQNGSLLILDENAKASWLFVKTEQDLNNDCIFAKDSDDCPKKVISLLQKKGHMVYFFSSMDYSVPTAHWAKYMHKAETLKGKSASYFYTYVESPSIYEKSLDNIVSFNEYFGKTRDDWE